jgi:division protein CdvB (Snf7/Vps24/ESCRT-III family)
MGLAKDIGKRWEGGESIGEKIKKTFAKKEPIKYRLLMSNYKIRSMAARIEVQLERLKERDRALFERVVDAIIAKDNTRATMLANEIAEIRKAARQLAMVQVALEQISMRIETVVLLGDTFASLAPVLGVVRELRGLVRGLMPEFSYEMLELEESLREVVLETGEGIAAPVSEATYASPEARKILEEAKIVAEQRIKESFPALPTIPSASQEVAKSEAG